MIPNITIFTTYKSNNLSEISLTNKRDRKNLQLICAIFSAVDCKHPGSIENGRVIVVNGSTTYGGAAEYHCLPQYERVGIFLRKCMDTGFWNGEEPKCERK